MLKNQFKEANWIIGDKFFHLSGKKAAQKRQKESPIPHQLLKVECGGRHYCIEGISKLSF